MQYRPGSVESGFVAAFELLMKRYFGRTDFTVGIPFLLSPDSTATVRTFKRLRPYFLFFFCRLFAQSPVNQLMKSR